MFGNEVLILVENQQQRQLLGVCVLKVRDLPVQQLIGGSYLWPGIGIFIL